jgi:Flp pilus assembly protein TadD
LQIEPANLDAHLELARVYTDIGMNEEAEDLYLKAVELRPDNWSAYSHLGFFYFMQDRLEDAVEATLKITELYPDNIRAYNNLLVFYYQLGDIDKAREMFDKSVALKPDADTYSNMGTMYILEGRYADAIPILEKAAELLENEPWIWGNLSDAYRYSPGMEHKAGPACRRAIDLAEEQLDVNPKDARLRADMAVYCAKAGDIDKALVWIALSKQLNPDDGKVLLDSGIIYEIAGRREEALRELERVVEIGGYDELMKKEPELSKLRQTEEYRRLVSP